MKEPLEYNVLEFLERQEKNQAELKKQLEIQEAKRLESLLPDKTKLKRLAEFLENGIEYPDVKSQEAKAIILRVQGKMTSISQLIYESIERM